MHDYISGIQQVGIGVTDAHAGSLHYKDLFGIDTLVFDDVAEAKLMTQYTGGKVYSRRAILAMNLGGGGGFEIWQYKNRTPTQPTVKPVYGDYGINSPKIKCKDVTEAHAHYTIAGVWVSVIQTNPAGEQHFWVKDHYGNIFNIVKGWHWFQQTDKITGGVSCAVIGVQDMDRAFVLHRAFYVQWRNFIKEKTKGTVFFDSVLFASLLIIYPAIVLLISVTIAAVTGNPYYWLLMLLIPFTAWSYKQYKSI